MKITICLDAIIISVRGVSDTGMLQEIFVPISSSKQPQILQIIPDLLLEILLPNNLSYFDSFRKLILMKIANYGL